MNTQVLIAGAGPTGLALALWLSQFNIPLRIIDKDKGPGETSRAMGVQARTLELYHQIGIADEVIAKGVIAKAFHLRVSGSEKACGQLDDMGENISPYPFILAFPQDEHERLLLAQLEKKGITVERHTELLQFSQTDADVCAVLRLPDASTTKISVPYLCGCDGARSTVRTELKIDFQGGTYSQLFYVADADVSGVAANDDLQLCLSEQEFTMVLPVRSSGTHRLIGIAPPALSDQTKISFKDVMPAILRDTQLKISAVHWFSTYHVHHRVAQYFREKRTFLLGDAAHIHSPVGGQGMNTGIADAINLAWKLAAVIQQRAAPLLLDTYQTERKAFALKLVSTTDRLFQIMTSVGTFGKYWRMKLFPFIVSHIIHYKAVRRFLFKTISQTSLHYRHSQLNQGRVGKLRSGDRLPWVNYGDHDNYVPLTALDWQVHVYGVVSSDYAAQLQKLLIPLHVFPSDARAKAVGLQRDVIFLVRPDGYLGLVDTQQDFKKLKKYLCDNKIISRRVKTRLDV